MEATVKHERASRIILRVPWARNASRIVYLGELMKLLNVHVLLDIADDLSRLAAWAGTDDNWLDKELPEGDEVISESLRHLDDAARICAD